MEKLSSIILSILFLLLLLPGSAAQIDAGDNRTVETQTVLGENAEYTASNSSGSEDQIIEGRYILEYDLREAEGGLFTLGLGTAETAHDQVKSALGSNNLLMSQSSNQGQGRFLRGFENAFQGSAVSNVSNEKLEELKNLSVVEEVHPDVRVEIAVDDSTGYLDATEVWKGKHSPSNLTGEGVSIAVIDTGVNYSHPDLGGCSETEFQNDRCGKVVGGYDFVNDDSDPMDDHGHGTHVAATAAGNGTLKGLAPGADIYAYKVLGSGGRGSSSEIIAGIDEAVKKDVDIISMSLGGFGTPKDPMSQAVMNAVDSGVTPVIAAGNSGPSPQTIGSPGDTKDAITVGASYNHDSVSKNAQLNLTDPEEKNYDAEFMEYSDYGNQSSYAVEASVIDAGNATQKVLEEKDVDGKIALYERSYSISVEDQAENLEEAGVAAGITTDSLYSNRFQRQINLPVATLSPADFSELRDYAEDGEANADLGLQMKPDKLASFSSRGPVISKEGSWTKPDVLAPGVSICAAQSGDYLESRTCTDKNHIELLGTSMATPQVSGIAALLLEKNPTWKSHKVKSALKMSADDLEYSYNEQGAGRVNITEALEIDQPPVVRLNNSGKVRGKTDIEGNVSDGNIDSWKLEIKSKQGGNWNQIADGTSLVNGVLKENLDTVELEQGYHKLRLTVNTPEGTREDLNYIKPSNIEIVTPEPSDYYGRDQINITGYATHNDFESFNVEKRELSWEGYSESEWNSKNIDVNSSNKAKEGGLLATWSPEKGSKILEFRLKVSTSGGTYTDNRYIYHDSMIAEGWPKKIAEPDSGFITLSYLEQPVVGNLTADKGLEIFSGYKKTVKLFNSTGSLKWDKKVNQDKNGTIQSSPVIADLNGDDENEIAVGDTDGRIHAFDGNGNYLSGYPVRAAYKNQDTVAAADLIGSQGKEIIAGGWGGEVHILDQDGVQRELNPDVTWIDTVQTIADINSDGKKEILVADFTEANKVIALTEDGDKVWAHAVNDNTHRVAPVVADINFDGENEIVMATEETTIDVLNSSGQSLDGFPKDIGYEINDLSLADVTGDGYLDIITGHGDAIFKGYTAVNRNGDKIEEYSDQYYIGPELGNLMLHGRGEKATIFGASYSGRNYRLEDDFSLFRMDAHRGGEYLETFPRFTQQAHWKTGTVADITGDGTKEWLSVTKGMEAFLYETPVNATSAPSWNTHQGGSQNDGYYPVEEMPPYIEFAQEKDEVLQSHTNNLTIDLVDREGLDELKVETNESGSWKEKMNVELSGEESFKMLEWRNASFTGEVKWRVIANDSTGTEEIVTETFDVEKHEVNPKNSISGNMTLQMQKHDEGEIKLQTNETGTKKNRSFILKEEDKLKISRSADIKEGEELSYILWEKIQGEWTKIRDGIYPGTEMSPAVNITQERQALGWEKRNNLSLETFDWKGLDTAIIQINRSGWEEVYSEDLEGTDGAVSYEWSNSSFIGEKAWRFKVNNTEGNRIISDKKKFRSYKVQKDEGSIMNQYKFTTYEPFRLSVKRPESGLDYEKDYNVFLEKKEELKTEKFSSKDFSNLIGEWTVEENTWKFNETGENTTLLQPRENVSKITAYSLYFDPQTEGYSKVETEYRTWNDTGFLMRAGDDGEYQINDSWTNSSLELNSDEKVSWASLEGTGYTLKSLRVYNAKPAYNLSFSPRNAGNYSLNLTNMQTGDKISQDIQVDPRAPDPGSINRKLMISAPRDIEITADAPYIDLDNSNVSVYNETDKKVDSLQINPTEGLEDAETGEEIPEGGCRVERYREKCTKIKSELNLSAGNYTIESNLSNTYGQSTKFQKELEVLESASIDPEVKEMDSEKENLYLHLFSDNNSLKTHRFLNNSTKIADPSYGFTYSGSIIDSIEKQSPPINYVGATYNKFNPSKTKNLSIDVSTQTKETQGIQLDLYGIIKSEKLDAEELLIGWNDTTPGHNVYGCKQMELDGCKSNWQKLSVIPGRLYDTSRNFTGLAYGKPIEQDEDEDDEEDNKDQEEKNETEEEEKNNQSEQDNETEPVISPDPQPELEVKQSINSVKVTGLSDDRGIEFNQTQLPVTSVSFSQPGENSSFEINSKEPDTSLEVYEGFKVDTDVEGSTTIRFSVSKNWLEERMLQPSDVSLYRISSSREDLDASVEKETSGKAFYEAKVEEFSTLAVASEKECGDNQEVSAVQDGSCQVYDNACQKPKDSREVKSCQVWEEKQEIEQQIWVIRNETEDEEINEALREAENALENQSVQQASEMVQEVQQERQQENQQDQKQNEESNKGLQIVMYIGLTALVLLLLAGAGFAGMKIYRKRRRQNMARKLAQLTDSLHTLRDRGYRIKEQARKLEKANNAVENGDFSKAREITQEVKEDIEQKMNEGNRR